MNTITLTKSQRKFSPKRLFQYAILIAVAYFSFRLFDSITKKREISHFYDEDDVADNVEDRVKNKDFDTGGDEFEFDQNMGANLDVLEIVEQERQNSKHRRQKKPKVEEEAELADNVEELNKMVEELDVKTKKRDKQRRNQPESNIDEDEVLEDIKDEIAPKVDMKKSNMIKDRRRGANRPDFDIGEDSPEVAKEKQKRRIEFFNKISQLNKEYDENKESDIHEDAKLLSFVTAAWTKTFNDAVNLINSVQQKYHTAEVIIYDIGLEKEQRKWLATLCQVTVKLSLIEIWPPHIKDLERKLWRPVILQMALAHHSHLIWIEPGLVIRNTKMNAYIEHSRRSGIVIAGKRQKYSTFVVTNPDMYYYLSSDTRKLMRVPHIEINMIILHNTNTVQQRVMKWLLACAVEEWCIAPVGSKLTCNPPPLPNAKYYANCHRFDESAINILLKSWMKYDLDKFSLRDVVTERSDGKDNKVRAKVCNSARKAGDL